MKVEKVIKHAIVISGGGNKGAAGCAKAARLNMDFDLGVGVSTGALMLVAVMLKRHGLLKTAYTNAKASDVFDKGKNPFKKNGNIRALYTAWRWISGKTSMGETKVLRETIKKTLTEDMYDELRSKGKEAVVGVYNEDYERMEYYSSNDCSYEDFIDWTWISACQPPAMSLVEKESSYNGTSGTWEYSDGGVQEVFPMREAVLRGAGKIVGILHRPKELPVKAKESTKNLPHRLFRLYNGLRREITNEDIYSGVEAAERKGIKYELHFVRQGYGENDLVFDSERMKQWYNAAFHEPIAPVTKINRNN